MKTLTPIILLSLFGVMLAGDCTAHPMSGIFTFVTQAAASTQTGVNFCSGLKTGQTCCTAAIINTFQTQTDNVAKTLSDKVKTRDTYIVDSRDKTLAGLTTQVGSLKTKAAAALTVLTPLTDPAPASDTSTTKNVGAKTLVTALQAIATDVTDNLAALKTGFTAMQKARTTCIVQLLKLQAAAFCLACDPAFDTKGVTGPAATLTIDLAASVKTRIKNACFPYLQGMDTQTNILTIAALSSKIDAINTALTAIGASTLTGKDDLRTAIAGLKIYDGAVTFDKKLVMVPASCTDAASCDWILTTWFVKGQLVPDAIVAGGDTDNAIVATGTTIEKTRLLEQERMLAGTWEPTEDEAGVSVTFQDDPAGVNPQPATTPSGSELVKSGLVSLIVVMLSAFLI